MPALSAFSIFQRHRGLMREWLCMAEWNSSVSHCLSLSLAVCVCGCVTQCRARRVTLRWCWSRMTRQWPRWLGVSPLSRTASWSAIGWRTARWRLTSLSPTSDCWNPINCALRPVFLVSRPVLYVTTLHFSCTLRSRVCRFVRNTVINLALYDSFSYSICPVCVCICEWRCVLVSVTFSV